VSADRRSPRVLIADDHAPSRDDIRRALERDQRFSVCASVADAAEAIQAAVQKRPAVCLLDIRMPGDGLAAAWEIAARLPRAKIVMLTVSDDDADLFAALRAGAHGYLLKTMNLQRLPDALEGVLSGEAAIPRTLVAHMLEQFRGHEPRWRRPVADHGLGQRLTSREWEVLALLAQQQSTGEIARRLMLSTVAVRVHIASIVRKLGVADRSAVINLFRGHAEM
jgi:DNA-binding NarL/FixJ family response regulator